MSRRHTFDMGAESGEDAVVSEQALLSALKDIDSKTAKKPQAPMTAELAEREAEAAEILLQLKRFDEARERSKPLFYFFLQRDDWQRCADICDLLYQCGHSDCLSALGQGVWLAVTFPVKLETTLTLLQHLIDETPDDADGAAVAAAAAVYVHELRRTEATDPDLYVDAMQMLTTVGRRHGGVHDQENFDRWMRKLELDNPEKFLVRLRNVIDVLVQDGWWFNRSEVQAKIPSDDRPTDD